jgi:hypothetical protein
MDGLRLTFFCQPPFVKVSDIVSEHLPSAIKDPKSPFKACAPYVHIFEKYGKEYGGTFV